MAICSQPVSSTINYIRGKKKGGGGKKKVLAKYLLLFDPVGLSVFRVCISMTRGQCQNHGTCVPDELAPDKTPADEKRTEALWDKSGVKDGANRDRLLVHTHTHTRALSLLLISSHTKHTPLGQQTKLLISGQLFSCCVPVEQLAAASRMPVEEAAPPPAPPCSG